MLDPRRHKLQTALTKANLDEFGENDSKADGLHFLFGHSKLMEFKMKRGTKAKCAWDLVKFQMLENISGCLTEFGKTIP